MRNMKKITSDDLEAKLIEWNEPELFTAFKAIIGCDGKIIFPSVDAQTYGEDRFEKQRRIISFKKDKVIELAKLFELDFTPLFEALNINVENIIKKTCKELGLTYSQLAEQIGYTEGALKTSVSTDKISNSMVKAIELYRKNLELEEKLLNSEKIKETLKEWLK